jgi:protein-tyrosine-phosphatase
MAEILAKGLAAEMGLSDVEIRSAGTAAVRGFPASGGAQRTAGRHGLNLAGHSSTPLSPELVGWASRIFTMSPSHLERVRAMGGGEESVLLGAFAKGEDEGGGRHLAVPDPFGGDDRVYEDTFKTLREYVGMALKRLARETEA